MKISEIANSFKQYIQTLSYPDSLESIILFGSFARGNAKVGSDLDIALVTGKAFSREDKINIREQLDNFNDQIKVSLFCTDRENIETTINKLNANYWIREEGIVLWKR